MLNSAKYRFTVASRLTTAAVGPEIGSVIAADVSKPQRRMLTAGPAIATANASKGVLDSASKLATPPNKKQRNRLHLNALPHRHKAVSQFVRQHRAKQQHSSAQT